MRRFFTRLWWFLRRDRNSADLEEEMRLNVQLRAESLERRGIPKGEARDAAKRTFGNTAMIEERSNDMWGFEWLEQLSQDVRFALRRLRQHPAFTVPILIVLALGIGATTAVFSAIDAALLRPLPFLRPHELVTLTNVIIPFNEERDEKTAAVSIEDARAMPALFSGAAAYASGGLNLADPDNPQRVRAGVVTANFFATLGVRSQQGRAFAEEEGKPDGPLVTILSHALWQRHFGGRDVVGTSIILHGRQYTVIGVMPPGFSFPNESDLWIPLPVPTTRATFGAFRGWLPSRVIARLAPGVPSEVASAQLLARWQQNVKESPPGVQRNYERFLDDVRQNGAAVPLQRFLVGDRRQALAILMGASALLLVIACANVANLMLTEAARRRREVAVRRVLGASRGRIVRQLLAESVLLSATGGLLGLAFAPGAMAILRLLLPDDLAGVAPAQLDLRVLGFATVLAVLVGIAFGFWPAIDAARTDAHQTIKSGGGHGATSGGLGRTRRVLVAAELAFTAMLLIGAGLMLKSFERLMSQNLGMKPARVGTLEMGFPRGSASRAERQRIIHGVMARVASEAGIDAVGVVNDLPLRGGGGLSIGVTVDAVPGTGGTSKMKFARWLMANGDYFRTMGIPLLRGRVFTSADDSLAPRVAVVSDSMARMAWPGMDPIGRTVHLPGDTLPVTVVGVVADVREGRVEGDPGPQIYVSIDAMAPDNVAIVARSSLSAGALLTRLTESVHSVDRSQAVYNARMMADVIGRSVAPRRTNTVLIATFAGLALALAALGVYAVVAYGVAQRSREFGIRTALGATAGDLLGLVSREMVTVTVVGVCIGLAGAWALTRVLAALLYGVDVHDAVTFTVVPLLLLVPAAVATLVPAWRATRVDTTEVMRLE